MRAIPRYRHYIQRPIFGETNFLNKIIFQFSIYNLCEHSSQGTWQKRNFPFFNKGFQNFCVELCYRHYKKIKLQFFVVIFFTRSLWWPIYNLPQLLTLNYSFKCNFLCSLDTSFLVNWMLSVLTKSFNNDRNKAAS